MNIHKIFLKLYPLLIKEALKNKRQYYILSAILNKQNEIMSIGYNSYCKTHPLQKKYSDLINRNKNKIYLHAEIASLVKNIGKPHSILIIRITKTGIVRIAKPCEVCMLAIKEARIKNIYYTNNNSEIIKERI